MMPKIILALILTITFSLGSFAQQASDVKTQTAIETVNINTADAETLARILDGVGEKKSAAIVDYRAQNGAFESLADLNQVYGIGEKTIERNQAKIIFSEPQKAQSTTPRQTQPHQANTPTTAPQKNDAQGQ